MSDSQSYEKLTVTSDGVTVDKRFEADEFPVPAIAFEIHADRDEDVTVTLVDDVPDDVAVEDLGFHPEYGSEYWNIEDDRISFERTFEAGEEYTTVYGIRATGTDNVEKFLTEPDLASVDPPLDDGSGGDPSPIVDQSGSDVVRDVISGDSDGVPGLDDDEEIGTLDLADPNGEDEASAATESEGDDAEAEPDDGSDEGDGDAGTDADAETTSDEPIASDTVTRKLADELRNGDVAGDDVKVLRRALELAGKEGGSVDARLQQLQNDVTDLRAYTSALEEFLNENGTGQQLIEDLREEIDDVQAALDDVEATVDANSEDLDALETTVEDVDDVTDEVDDLQGDVDGLLSSVKSIENDVDSLEDRIDDVDDVQSDIEDIKDEIEELKEWREQLSSVIGG